MMTDDDDSCFCFLSIIHLTKSQQHSHSDHHGHPAGHTITQGEGDILELSFDGTLSRSIRIRRLCLRIIMTSQNLPVSVRVKYTLNKKNEYDLEDNNNNIQTFSWDDTNVTEARMGLPEHQKPLPPVAGEYSYSGTHDHGRLPSLRQGGPMAQLIACVQQAKLNNDQFLTSRIAQQQQNNTISNNTDSLSHSQQKQPGEEQQHVDKKVKVGTSP